MVFTWQDDGCGIDGSHAAFRKLLAGGASGWDDEGRRNQAPLGVGLHALLAHEDVRRIAIAGGKKATEIERDKWWTDKEYYTAWKSRIRPGTVETGLQIAITIKAGTAKDCEQLQRSLKADVEMQACGYHDIMRVVVDGEEVAPVKPLKGGFTATYQGCHVQLLVDPRPDNSYRTHERSCRINWYGQFLTVDLGSGEVAAYTSHRNDSPICSIAVRDGSPFDMRSPSRRGVVNNAKWRAFVDWMGDQCTQYLNAMKSPAPRVMDVTRTLHTWPKQVTKLDWCVVSRHNKPHEVARYETLKSLTVLDGDFFDVKCPNTNDARITLGSETENRNSPTPYDILPTAWTDRIRFMAGQYDAARVSLRSLEIELSDPVESLDISGDVTVYRKGEARLLDADDNVLERYELEDECTFVQETAAWDLDMVGAILTTAEAPDYEELLQDFWRYDDDDADGSEKSFDRNLAEWLHERETKDSKVPFMHDDSGIRDLLRRMKSGDVLKPVRGETGGIWGVEIVSDTGASQKIRLL